MSRTPTVSLIISNYNYGEFLYDAIVCALNQTQPACEIIVIDDCSTDHSREVIERIAKEAPSVKPIYNQSNLGCNRSINRAAEIAQGEYICSAGADDPLHNRTFFENAGALCAEHPEVSFCYGEHLVQYRTDKAAFANAIQVRLADSPSYFSAPQVVELYRRRTSLSVPTSPALWKRTEFLAIGGLRHELSWFADWFIALVFSARRGACYLPGLYQTIRFSPKSFSLAGMAAAKDYSTLLHVLLNTLEQPEFADVRDFFRIPSVLSRHGFKLLNVLISEPRFSHYLSLDLVKCATLAENLAFNVNLDSFGASPPPHVVREACRMILKNYAAMLKKQAENERRNGRLSVAFQFCAQASDAMPDDSDIATLLDDLRAQCARWSRIATSS